MLQIWRDSFLSDMQFRKFNKKRENRHRQTKELLQRMWQTIYITEYSYQAYHPNTNQQIILFTKEGLGIRSTARVLRISVTTLLKRIITIAIGIVSFYVQVCKIADSTLRYTMLSSCIQRITFNNLRQEK